MNQLYEHINITKQAHLSFLHRQELQQQEIIILLSAIADLREMHPEMGARKMYHIIKPDNIGRDKFILLSIENGFGVHKQRSFQRTTYNSYIYKYKNLIDGAVLFDINNVWVSDITYFRVQQVYFYLTFILDLYSRRIIGSIAYPSLEAKANILALNMALKTRDVFHYDNLIHHSDRGTQYTSNAYTDLLLKKNISISMCDSVYQNVHAERVNGIIKNEYLKHWTINSFSSLKLCLKKAVSLYNYERPHMALNYMTPVEYEAHIKNISISDHVGLHMYSSIIPEKDH